MPPNCPPPPVSWAAISLGHVSRLPTALSVRPLASLSLHCLQWLADAPQGFGEAVSFLALPGDRGGGERTWHLLYGGGGESLASSVQGAALPPAKPGLRAAFLAPPPPACHARACWCRSKHSCSHPAGTERRAGRFFFKREASRPSGQRYLLVLLTPVEFGLCVQVEQDEVAEDGSLGAEKVSIIVASGHAAVCSKRHAC